MLRGNLVLMSESPANNSSPKAAGAADGGFAAFGPVEARPLSNIQKLVGAHMVRNWTTIPHVTHHEEADVTDLEVLRGKRAKEGVRITPLAYLVKASVAALRALPQFNASLDPSGSILILKRYFNIGVAVDTPRGLLVPVIRSADSKSVAEIAAEIAEVSAAARAKGLPLSRMSGGCFTISSLGALGGTGFTPIINAPELAVLGVTRSCRQPREGSDGALVWRTVLPLSLSYDHRVINGGDAARFCLELAAALATPEAL